MSAILLLSIFMLASVSLMSYLYCWTDIRGGKPHILSLRQVTCIMDRAQINQRFGMPDKGYRYKLTPLQLKAFMGRYQYSFYRECATDLVCALGAWRFLTRDASSQLLWGFIVLGLICQGAYLAYSVTLVRKWGHQIREEIDNSED